MSSNEFAIALGKVVAAVAWADGAVVPEEVNSLKDLLFRYFQSLRGSGLTTRQWAELEMYLQALVEPAERARLVAELQSELWTLEDRAALDALEAMAQADGEMTEAERKLAAEVAAAIQEVGPGLLGQLGRLMRGAISRRSRALRNAPNRDRYFEEFMRNRVYYGVLRRLNKSENEFRLTEDDMRRLCLAGGLLARVAHADRQVTGDEVEAMTRLLHGGWEVSREEAVFVVETALDETSRDMDLLRLTRDLFSCTTERERIGLIEVLFLVAASHGDVTPEEADEIYDLAVALAVTDTDFRSARARHVGRREQ